MSVHVRAQPFPITRCRSCGAQVVWAYTDSGMLMPVDAVATVDGKLTLSYDDDVVRVRYLPDGYGGNRHRAHLRTCTDRRGWRRR